jgi:hypothetical protein
MPGRSGRLEKRIQLAVAIQIFSPLDPSAAERTLTENVSPLGVRIQLQHARAQNEKVIVISSTANQRTPARVVYCHALPGGHFAVGLEFQGMVLNWPRDSSADASD